MKKYKNTAWNIYSVLYILGGIISLVAIIIAGIKIIGMKQEYQSLLGKEFFWFVGIIFVVFILLSATNFCLFFALSTMNTSIENLYNRIDKNSINKEKQTANENSNQNNYSYTITTQCQVCSVCQEICPAGAIIEKNGKLFIDQTICIHCGLCEENCPYQAIENLKNN